MRHTLQSLRPLVYLAASAGLLALSLAVPITAAAREVSIPFDPANFSDPTEIDNPLFPLVPGRTYIYRAVTKDGCEEFHFEVTNNTRLVAGVRTRVIHDIAYEDPGCTGDLIKVEDTFDWHAQDDAGNVWYFGENTKDCTGNVCTPGPGSWEAGVNGARAGLYMLAAPRNSDNYYQEFAKGIAEDQAQVEAIKTDVSLAAPAALFGGFAYQQNFAGCLKTKDYTALDPGHVEHKFYCPRRGSFAGGLVAVDELRGGTVRFELISVSGQ
jgi:hypothetical protein